MKEVYKVRSFCLYIVTPILAFIGGVLSYIFTVKFGWNKSISGDLRAVLFWGSAVYAIVIPFYFGVIYLIDRRFEKLKGLFFTVACMFIFLIPTFPILALFWIMTDPFSLEIMPFYSFFMGAGLIFGLSTWFFKRNNVYSLM